MGCSERQVRRGMRSLREAGVIDVRRRVRPCEASYVWVLPVRSDGAGVRSDGVGVLSGVRSDVLSGVLSHTEPRTEPRNNHGGSSRAREVCKICGNNWPAEYGTVCHKCPQPTAIGTTRTGAREAQQTSREMSLNESYGKRHRMSARAEMPTAIATEVSVSTARASPAQRRPTRPESKTLAGA